LPAAPAALATLAAPAQPESPAFISMSRRAGPHRGLDLHYGDPTDAHDGAHEGAGEAGERPSKTRLKEEASALQKLGGELAELPAERLAAIDLPDALRAAIDELRRIRSHEGRRRQLQYVGKLMRSTDADALRAAIAAATLGSARATLRLHEAERWRAALIADDAALERWLLQHPGTDTQQLRSLVRAARRDAAGLAPEARQPRSYRELFQFIKPMVHA
jgi:ribosome-associated protein